VILPGVQDLSDFQQFEFSRTPALGFCPPVDSVYSATIDQDEEGRLLLRISILEERTASVDDCESEILFSDCPVVRELPARELTAEESDRLRSLLQTVAIETVLHFPVCVDPCCINYVRWDDFELTDHKSCGGAVPYLSLSYEEMDKIIEFLDALAVDAE
jgi:hypothetical protein